eukprot:Blabericola_migrator_1__9006@NODE_479_length_8179_cov_106_519354_g373_i0_p8_GENE_NODE_479_length_8179_cov_106_519354_g373_i0NODE_479_length_8179_cov_106_519354_g373_i0_p8_ORF_typecomplete_len137_score1_70_NODE_479_length_8179_cov_106_519354_g373_i035603970
MCVYVGVPKMPDHNIILSLHCQHQKHWKCALAELVATAASVQRMSEIVWANERLAKTSEWKPDTSSPSTVDSCSTLISDDPNSPFVEGGIWLMPSELHLFWNLTGPPASNWNDLSSGYSGGSLRGPFKPCVVSVVE